MAERITAAATVPAVEVRRTVGPSSARCGAGRGEPVELVGAHAALGADDEHDVAVRPAASTSAQRHVRLLVQDDGAARPRRPAPRRRRSGPAARPPAATPAAPACRPRGPLPPTWPGRARPCRPSSARRSARPARARSRRRRPRSGSPPPSRRAPPWAAPARRRSAAAAARSTLDVHATRATSESRPVRASTSRVQDGPRPVAEVDALTDARAASRRRRAGPQVRTSSTRSPTAGAPPRSPGSMRNSAAVIWRRTRP